ncbi:MAG TPA: hypothetical protein PK504_00010 [Ferruginibacter sp.]|nr:hypothetical protein [Ferruginibacter sp.]HRE64617.1 hypothetical protein [Ferruginibacter sp.]
MHFRISFLLSAFIFYILLFASCKSNNAPDVSGINVPLKVLRFEKDFFAMDTNKLVGQLDTVIAKYPLFGENFVTTILNVDPRWGGDTTANYIKGFLSSYKAVYDSSLKVFNDFTAYEKQLKQGLQYTKHYFPEYKIPTNIITYIGPLDGYGDILDADALIVGLHQHLGSNFSLYATGWVRETYPDYITARFTPDYIAVNAMKNITLDLFPEKSEDKSLLIQMVEKGKRLYLLQKLLPNTQSHLLIGYTKKQWEACIEKQVVIWDLFIQNNFLQTLDYNVIKNYVGESPKTQELGEGAPGNIGSFAGWQIVNKYMDKHSETTLPDLMKMDAEELFQKAKYKP